MRKTTDVTKYVGEKIKQYRLSYAGGLSQEELAIKLKVAPNTVSRWETATYKPKLKDLDRLALFFNVPISSFFPEDPHAEPVSALLRAAKGLHKDDLDALTQFAEIKKAQYQLKKAR